MLSYYLFSIGPLIFFGCLAYGQYRKWKTPPGKEKRLADTIPNIIGIALGGPLIWASVLVFSKVKAKGKARYKAFLKTR